MTGNISGATFRAGFVLVAFDRAGHVAVEDVTISPQSVEHLLVGFRYLHW